MSSNYSLGFGIFSAEELEEFNRGENIEKCLLRSWVYIENQMFQALSKHFSFENDIASLKWIATFGEGGKSTSFEKKFQLLQKLHLFSKGEIEAITKFQKDRNDLFHNEGSLILARYDKAGTILENALNACQAVKDFESRKYEAPSIESMREKHAREK